MTTKTKEKQVLEPLLDRIVLKRIDYSQTEGLIVIPDSAKEKPQEAEVIAVGPGKFFETGIRKEPTLKVGDRVLFGKYVGSEVKIDGEDLLIMREEDVLVRIG